MNNEQPRTELLPNVLARHAVVLRSMGKHIIRPGLSGIQLERISKGLLSVSDQLMDISSQILTQMEAEEMRQLQQMQEAQAEKAPPEEYQREAKVQRFLDEYQARRTRDKAQAQAELDLGNAMLDDAEARVNQALDEMEARFEEDDYAPDWDEEDRMRNKTADLERGSEER